VHATRNDRSASAIALVPTFLILRRARVNITCSPLIGRLSTRGGAINLARMGGYPPEISCSSHPNALRPDREVVGEKLRNGGGGPAFFDRDVVVACRM